jgi:hypothetical protein
MSELSLSSFGFLNLTGPLAKALLRLAARALIPPLFGLGLAFGFSPFKAYSRVKPLC